MEVTLVPITAANLRKASLLNVREDQKNFVAANVYSIAQAQFYESWDPRGVYAEDEIVGFVMWGLDDDKSEPEWWIIRLMVDAAYQGKGYGKAATLAAIDELKSLGATEVFLSFEPTNEYARAFYEHLGFADTGRVEHEEVVFRLPLS